MIRGECIWGLGVALSGGETDDLRPSEPRGELRLMKPKSVVGVDLNGRTFTHIPTQNLTTDRPLRVDYMFTPIGFWHDCILNSGKRNTHSRLAQGIECNRSSHRCRLHGAYRRRHSSQMDALINLRLRADFYISPSSFLRWCL